MQSLPRVDADMPINEASSVSGTSDWPEFTIKEQQK
jgi:hypothetical protein